MTTIPSNISDMLEKALGKNITEYNVTLGEGNSKGLGFVSELVFISLTSKSTGEEHHIAIKQALPTGGAASMNMMRSSFANEIHFYQTCWPILRSFQESYPLAKPFRGIAKCYGAARDAEHEKIALENLKAQGFAMYERTEAFDMKHMEAVFRTYAEFHALSFAYRHKNSEDKFEYMTKPLYNGWPNITNALFFGGLIKYCCESALGRIEPEIRDKIGSKLQKYMDGLKVVFGECVEYTGSCPVLVHGDCWSSNFMFKYNESKDISEIKLLDFQVARKASAVHDLSYSFYSSASKKVLQNLDDLLHIYHDALSAALVTYGCAVDEIYPLRTLKEEWRKHSKFGMMLAMMLWRSKLTDANDVADLNKLMDNDLTELQRPRKIDLEKYAEKVTDIVINMYENDAL